MVRTTAAYGAIEFFQRTGLDPDTVLNTVGLLREELLDPTGEISLSQYCRMFEVAASMAGRSNLGLEFGVNFLPQHLGHIGYLSVTAPTVGRALRCMAEELPFHQQATFIGLETFGSSRLALSYTIVDESVLERRQDAEFSLTVLLNLLRQALGPGWCPSEVHFSHGRPGQPRTHERIFGSVIRFDEDANRIVFPKDFLDVSMPRRDDVLHGLLRAEITRQRKLGGYDTDVVASVRYQIERLLPKGNCDLENVASACGIPPWSVKRKLRARGLSFQDLLLAVRQELAPLYLKRGMPATEVALSLGYSELSAFSRAFRQWTGLSPRDFVRDAERGDCS
jgi:AraC-like DNA-binding protein